MLALWAMLTASVYAQTATGRIVGVIKDTSGAVIPNASVSVFDEKTGQEQSPVTAAEDQSFVERAVCWLHDGTPYVNSQAMNRTAPIAMAPPKTMPESWRLPCPSEKANTRPHTTTATAIRAVAIS